MTNPAQTIPGTYRMLEMPDRTQELVEQVVINGKRRWVFVEDRLADQEAFEKRFADTRTIPADLPASTTRAIEPKPGHAPICPVQALATRQHLEAHLVAALGTPETIIMAKGLEPERADRLRRNTAERETLRNIIRALNIPLWNQVGELL